MQTSNRMIPSEEFRTFDKMLSIELPNGRTKSTDRIRQVPQNRKYLKEHVQFKNTAKFYLDIMQGKGKWVTFRSNP